MGSLEVQSQMEGLAFNSFHVHIMGQWIVLTSNQFDLHLPDLPPFQSLSVLYNWHTQEFFCRSLGRAVEQGYFVSLEELSQFAQETFQSKSACIGKGDFPSSSIFSEECAKFVPKRNPFSPTNDCAAQFHCGEFRCESCQQDFSSSLVSRKTMQDIFPDHSPTTLNQNARVKEENNAQPLEQTEAQFGNYNQDVIDHDIKVSTLIHPDPVEFINLSLTKEHDKDDAMEEEEPENPLASISVPHEIDLPPKKCTQSNPPKLQISPLENQPFQSKTIERSLHVFYPKNVRNRRRADGKYECEECQHTTMTKSGIDDHKKYHHGWGCFVCQLCPSEFKEVQMFIRHMKEIHTGVSRVKCPQCKEFIHFESDLKHFEAHYSACIRLNSRFTKRRINRAEKMEVCHYQCEICGRKFRSKKSLQKHQSIHESKLFECRECHFQGPTPLILARHMGMHGDPRVKIRCPDCDYVTQHSSAYKAHFTKIHCPFQCAHCPEVLDGKVMHLNHASQEHGLKKLCDVCEKGFKDSKDLEKHMLSHAEPSFLCGLCHQRFKAKYKLVQHERRKHHGEAKKSTILKK